ncbi:MAG: RNA polymerase sigma factor [Planctomycetota bacterium JB042]
MDLAITAGDPKEGAPAPANALEEELALVRRAVDEPRAFAILYRRHYDRMATYLYRRTGDPHATEDLLSELFLAAWRGLPRFEPRGVPVRGWLYGIATRLANRRARRRRPVESLDDPGAIEGRDRTDGRDDADEVRTLLAPLSPNHQAALVLHYVEGLSVDEIAAALGIRPGTVKSRLDRARRKLRSQIQARRSS